MNKRIKELWEQSGGHYSKGDQWKYPEYTIDNPKKFAELIVRECIRVAHAAERKPEGFLYAKGAHILETEIYNHFGVKE